MLRSILGAVGGYVVIVIVVLAGIGLAWMALGGEGAFAGDGPAPSTTWMLINLGTGFVAALAGGCAARAIGTSATAVYILIGLILVLGLVSAVVGAGAEGSAIDKPVAELTFAEAGQYAVQPGWYNWVVPIVGAAGAWLGGQRRGDRQPQGG